MLRPNQGVTGKSIHEIYHLAQINIARLIALEHHQKNGATPHSSFWFSQQFPQPADDGVCV
jgi:hypothetical protein